MFSLICSVCGKPYEASRRMVNRTAYCSDACRQLAYRRRKTLAHWTPSESLTAWENDMLGVVSLKAKDPARLAQLVADVTDWYDAIDRQDIVIVMYRLVLALHGHSADKDLVARIPRKVSSWTS